MLDLQRAPVSLKSVMPLLVLDLPVFPGAHDRRLLE